MRKKVLNIASIAAIVTGVVLFIVNAGAVAPPAPAVSAHDIDFPDFPKLTTKTVEFQPFDAETSGDVQFRQASYWNGYSQNSRGTRETLDQLRDWLFMTVLSSSNLSQDDVSRVLFDLPPVRRGALNSVANFEYGVTRSRATTGGHVLALIPVSSQAERIVNLAHIEDEERKNTGTIPGVLDVFEYSIDPDASTAEVRRLEPIPGNDFFGGKGGYFETDLHSKDDLTRFMSTVNDVTWAHDDGGILRVGGRQVDGYRGIRVEDIAAIWQSEEALGGRLRGSGFSLDPQIDFVDIKDDRVRFELQLTFFGATDDQIKEVMDGLDNKSTDAYLRISGEVCRSRGVEDEAKVCSDKFRHLLLSHRFQAARYDGQMKGTEVGMVLFYTDLLMKLWSFDFQHATPASQVEGFPNETQMTVARVFKDEWKRFPETRLWLGSLDRGFQIGAGRHEILLARNATRVFAVPHDFLENKDRADAAEPNVLNRIFISWWNQHYEEVGFYEKEYQRLNEIMKWSQIISWLNSESASSRLSFLADVPVKRDNNFTEWVHRHPALTYHDWAAVGFKPAGYHGATTEALPLLSSRVFDHFGDELYLEGGVSLADREALAARSALSEDVNIMSRRAGLDYSGSLGDKLRTIEKTEYEFTQEKGIVDTLSKPAAGQRLRSLVGEFRNQNFERTLTRDANGVIFSEKAASGSLGDLHIARSPGGYRVGWVQREVDAGEAVARRMSSAPDPEQALLHDPSLQTVVKLGKDGEYLVKPRTSDAWVKLVRSESDTSDLKAGFDARISAPGLHASDIDVNWIRGGVSKELPQDSWVEIGSEETPGGVATMREAARPPPSANRAEISWRGKKLTTQVDGATGKVYAKWSELPDELRGSPDRIRELAAGHTLKADQQFASTFRDIANADYQSAARSIAGNPSEFRSAFNAHLEDELTGYDRLVAEQKLMEARVRLNAMLSVYGNEPRLTLRLALNDIAQGHPANAARLAENLGGQKLYDADGFFAEVDHRIQLSRSPLEANNLREFANYTAVNQAKLAAHDPLLANFQLATNDDRLVVTFRTDKLPARSAAPGDLVSHPDAPIYIQDSPGLGMIDFHAGVSQKQLESLVASGRISVQKVNVSELSTYRPSAIVETRTGVQLYLANQRSTGFSVRNLGHLPSNSSPDCKSQSDPDGNCGTVYVVTEKRSA